MDGSRLFEILQAFMGHSIKETSVPFDIDRPLTEAELAEIMKYCRHDVEETVEVWLRSIEEFNTTMFFVNHFHLYELRGQLNGQNYTLNPDKVQTSGPKDNMTAIVDKIVDFEADIDRHIDKLVDLKRETTDLIKKIPDQNQQALLIGRYVCRKTWEPLADDLHCSVRSLFRLHGKALLAFYEIMPES